MGLILDFFMGANRTAQNDAKMADLGEKSAANVAAAHNSFDNTVSETADLAQTEMITTTVIVV